MSTQRDAFDAVLREYSRTPYERDLVRLSRSPDRRYAECQLISVPAPAPIHGPSIRCLHHGSRVLRLADRPWSPDGAEEMPWCLAWVTMFHPLRLERQELASITDDSVALAWLSEEGDWRTRLNVAGNPSAPNLVLVWLGEDPCDVVADAAVQELERRMAQDRQS